MSQYQPWSSSKTERADLRSGGRTLVALALASAALLAGCAGDVRGALDPRVHPGRVGHDNLDHPAATASAAASLPTPHDRCCQASMN